MNKNPSTSTYQRRIPCWCLGSAASSSPARGFWWHRSSRWRSVASRDCESWERRKLSCSYHVTASHRCTSEGKAWRRRPRLEASSWRWLAAPARDIRRWVSRWIPGSRRSWKDRRREGSAPSGSTRSSGSRTRSWSRTARAMARV